MPQIVPHQDARFGHLAGYGVPPTSSGFLARRNPVTREIDRINGGALLRAVHIDTEARLTDAKISASSGLASSAQQHVAQVTAMEAELTKAVPLAGARLEMIGNLATLALSEMVTDAIATFRRM